MKWVRNFTQLNNGFVLVVTLFAVTMLAGCYNLTKESDQALSQPVEMATPKPEREVEVSYAVEKILRGYDVWCVENLRASDPFPIRGREDEAAVVCFIFSDDTCTGELIWFGSLELQAWYPEKVAFYEEELDLISEIYRTQEEIAVTYVKGVGTCIVRKSGEAPIVLGGELPDNYETIDVFPEAFEPIVLRVVYKEPGLLDAMVK